MLENNDTRQGMFIEMLENLNRFSSKFGRDKTQEKIEIKINELTLLLMIASGDSLDSDEPGQYLSLDSDAIKWAMPIMSFANYGLDCAMRRLDEDREEEDNA